MLQLLSLIAKDLLKIFPYKILQNTPQQQSEGICSPNENSRNHCNTQAENGRHFWLNMDYTSRNSPGGQTMNGP